MKLQLLKDTGKMNDCKNIFEMKNWGLMDTAHVDFFIPIELEPTTTSHRYF